MEPKSGVLWLKIGDNNTKFFHCQATQKHKKKITFEKSWMNSTLGEHNHRILRHH